MIRGRLGSLVEVDHAPPGKLRGELSAPLEAERKLMMGF